MILMSDDFQIYRLVRVTTTLDSDQPAVQIQSMAIERTD